MLAGVAVVTTRECRIPASNHSNPFACHTFGEPSHRGSMERYLNPFLSIRCTLFPSQRGGIPPCCSLIAGVAAPVIGDQSRITALFPFMHPCPESTRGVRTLFALCAFLQILDALESISCALFFSVSPCKSFAINHRRTLCENTGGGGVHPVQFAGNALASIPGTSLIAFL
jgi:hypothetical protein